MSTSIVIGSRMSMYKQDPLDELFGVRTTFVPSQVTAGPKDDTITIAGLSAPVQPNKNGDFTVPAKDKDGKIVPPNTEQFDAIHTFAVVRMVVTMYERGLRETDPNFKQQWQWGNGNISVFPRAGVEENAYYSREEKALKFFFFNDQKGEKIYTCRSFDIVAHETGHAFLDSIKPNYYGSSNPQTGALHEAFGDITALFCLLSQLDVCEALIAQTKGDLRSDNFFDGLAEQFGEALGMKRALRYANNDKTMHDGLTEVHDLSVVLTGTVYDIIVDFFNALRDYKLNNPAETLYSVGKYVRRAFINAVQMAPDQNATFGDVANGILKYGTLKAQDNNWPNNWKAILDNIFQKRFIFDEPRMKFSFAEGTAKIGCESWRRVLRKGAASKTK